jgi:hypothetical protein
MHGPDVQQLGIFSHASVDERVPTDRPIRKLQPAVSVIRGPEHRRCGVGSLDLLVQPLANALMGSRNGLLIGIDVRHAGGTGERDGALKLVYAHLQPGATLGANKGCDAREFVEQLERRGIRARIAHNTIARVRAWATWHEFGGAI